LPQPLTELRDIEGEKMDKEIKWECPYCGKELPDPTRGPSACCGEPGHAQRVEYKEYPCGCSAGPAEEVPDYCPTHGEIEYDNHRRELMDFIEKWASSFGGLKV
jgi:hypothetical protein